MNDKVKKVLFKLLLKQLFTEAYTAFSLNDWYNFVSEK